MTNRTEQEIMKSWAIERSPVVSICCITYNHEKYISEAIDSFLMQKTNFPFEILIHDDASTDLTKKIIMEYVEKYPHIIRPIFQTENQYSKGSLIFFRFVFPKAKGKYLALCEGDDYWTDSTKIQKQVEFLEENPEYVITYTDSQPFDENGHVDTYYGGTTRDVSSDELKRCIPLYTLTTCFRNVLDKVPQDLISAKFGDLVMWSLLGAYGKGKYLPNISPAAYRVHGDGVFSKKTKSQRFTMAKITNNALLAYYYRMNNQELAEYFQEANILVDLRLLGLFSLFKKIIKQYVLYLSSLVSRKIKKSFYR